MHYAKHMGESLFVGIPAGTYPVGTSHEDRMALALGIDDDSVPRVISLSAFMISVRPVSVAAWREFDKATGSKWEWWESIVKLQARDEDPIVLVDWYEAVRYSEWFGERFRCNAGLPFEDEWEVACRLSMQTPSHGERIGPRNDKIKQLARICLNSLSPNALVSHLAMGQSVLEWCWDSYLWTSLGEPEESFPMRRRRTVKGWRPPFDRRCGCRTDRAPSYRGAHVGFRLAITA